MQFTINTVAASMALLATLTAAAPNQQLQAPGTVSLKFVDNGDSATTRDVPFGIPQPFIQPHLPNITIITLTSNFGFCTFFDFDGKSIGDINFAEADLKAGNKAPSLEFAKPAQVGSYFCSADLTTKPRPAEVTVPAPNTYFSKAAPVAAPAPVKEEAEVPAKSTVTIQVTADPGVEARQFEIPKNGTPTDVIEVENTQDVVIIEGSATCTLYNGAWKPVGTVSNAQRASFKDEEKIKIATVVCVAA